MSEIGRGRQAGRNFLKNIKDKAVETNKGLDLYFVTVVSVSGDLVTVSASVGGGASRQVARSKGPNIAIGDRGLLIETTGGGMTFIPTGGVDEHYGGQNNSLKLGEDASVTLRGHAIGYSAFAADASVAVGYNSDAAGYVSLAFGFSAKGAGNGAIGIGYHSGTLGAAGDNSIAIGYASESVGNYAIAMGYAATTAGNGGIAIGYATDSGASGVALGYIAQALGQSAIAIGLQAEASGTYTVAVGTISVATGGSAFGYNAKSLASNSTVIGSSSTNNNLGGTIIGSGNTVSADYGVAAGYNITVTGLRGISIGVSSLVTAGYGIAIGSGANAGYSGDSYGEVAIGRGASAKTARGIAIGYLATTTYHYEAKIMARGLVLESSQTGFNTTKLGLVSPNGTRYYVYVTDAGVLTTTTSW